MTYIEVNCPKCGKETTMFGDREFQVNAVLKSIGEISFLSKIDYSKMTQEKCMRCGEEFIVLLQEKQRLVQCPSCLKYKSVDIDSGQFIVGSFKSMEDVPENLYYDGFRRGFCYESSECSIFLYLTRFKKGLYSADVETFSVDV